MTLIFYLIVCLMCFYIGYNYGYTSGFGAGAIFTLDCKKEINNSSQYTQEHHEL